jgi:hypothetical protein
MLALYFAMALRNEPMIAIRIAPPTPLPTTCVTTNAADEKKLADSNVGGL